MDRGVIAAGLVLGCVLIGAVALAISLGQPYAGPIIGAAVGMVTVVPTSLLLTDVIFRQAREIKALQGELAAAERAICLLGGKGQ